MIHSGPENVCTSQEAVSWPNKFQIFEWLNYVSLQVSNSHFEHGKSISCLFWLVKHAHHHPSSLTH